MIEIPAGNVVDPQSWPINLNYRYMNKELAVIGSGATTIIKVISLLPVLPERAKQVIMHDSAQPYLHRRTPKYNQDANLFPQIDSDAHFKPRYNFCRRNYCSSAGSVWKWEEN
ncbi:hypothetical protein F4678DRAFT_425389 [Xylaria arbuscula]|nr:hypothetical protein F4678DRAFT_425389 [Xylaria arbuscula]